MSIRFGELIGAGPEAYRESVSTFCICWWITPWTCMGFQMKGQAALGRIGVPENVSGLVSFLVSKEASFITGVLDLLFWRWVNWNTINRPNAVHWWRYLVRLMKGRNIPSLQLNQIKRTGWYFELDAVQRVSIVETSELAWYVRNEMCALWSALNTPLPLLVRCRRADLRGLR